MKESEYDAVRVQIRIQQAGRALEAMRIKEVVTTEEYNTVRRILNKAEGRACDRFSIDGYGEST